MEEMRDGKPSLDAFVDSGVFLPFYGMEGDTFRLGNLVFEASEDDCDGYRSSLGDIFERTNERQARTSPLARVRVVYHGHPDYLTDDEVNDFAGYTLEDESGHRWAYIGTIEMQDYYPCYRALYNPRRDQTDFAQPTASDFKR